MLVFAFVCILCWVSICDIYTQRIPDSAILAAIGFRILYFLFTEGFYWKGLGILFLNGLAISLPLLFFILAAEKLYKKELIGGGDIKLMFVTGLYLGWERSLWTLFFACLIGCLVGLKQRNTYFPFGPSIAVAAIISMNFF